MLRKLERFKQNPLRVLVTKGIFDEVTYNENTLCRVVSRAFHCLKFTFVTCLKAAL